MRENSAATIEFLVEEQNYAGGSGANFVVEWTSENPLNHPIIEVVMVGGYEGESISLIRQSVPIQ